MTNSNTFCTMAYNGISINQDGTLDPCCQYLPDKYQNIKFTDYATYVNTIRQQMHDDHVAGRRHSGCKKCWQEEDLGLMSLRQTANDHFHKGLATPEVSEHNPILDVELRFGNLCNLKCMMCDPKASSALHTERLMNAEAFQAIDPRTIRVLRERIPEWWETEDFKAFSDKVFRDARKVNITGGEPFMISETVAVLDRLLAANKNVFLSFNTNLTKLPNAILDRIVQFPNLSMGVSLEGVGAMAEYLRYPCNWQDIDANLKKLLNCFDKSNRKIFVHTTFQHGSIYSLPALAEYCFDLQVPLNYTTVQGIDCLKLPSVPMEDCKKFLQWLDVTPHVEQYGKNFLRNAVNDAKFDPELHKVFRKYVSTLDAIRGTSWDKTFQPSCTTVT